MASENKASKKKISDSQKEYIKNIMKQVPKNERFMILKTYLFCMIPDELYLTPLFEKIEMQEKKFEMLEKKIKELEEKKANPNGNDVKVVNSEEEIIELVKLGYECQFIGENKWLMKREQI